jgi:MinD superfamily P-loop ATPase
MKELIVLSGKGGTGKTTIVGSLATLAKDKVLTDCDVDAADLHLLLQPKAVSTNEFWGGKTAVIDTKRCTECGLCIDICRYGAISDEYEADAISCEGCGFCYNVCPADAIEMKENMAGHWFVSNTKYGPLVHAKLGIAQENSGKLVATVRQNARALAKEKNFDLIISDGPPGIGCPVISSLSGSSLALLVTEPTLSGIHDLERVIGTCQHFGVPAVVCINKYDINEENSRAIEDNCKRMKAEVISKIPFDNVVTEALVHGVPVVEYSDGKVSKEIAKLWTQAEKML